MPDRDDETPLKYPHWQRVFDAALLKGDPQTLRQRIDAAEAALFLRSQALAKRPDKGRAEQRAISEAMQTLRAIQRDKLGYPRWEKE